MKVSVTRSGGLAGGHTTFGPVDTKLVPPAVAQELTMRVERLLASAGTRAEPIGADFIVYELRVEGLGSKESTLKVADEGDPNDPALADILTIVELL
jgi:hypothetical protein